MNLRACSLAAIAWLLLIGPVFSQVDTTFTYQGNLTVNGANANGAYDFQFELWDRGSNGMQLGSTQTLDDVLVADGVFTVLLDFGAQFDNSELWLEIAVRQGTSMGGFQQLLPRSQMTAAPQAQYADYAALAGPWQYEENGDIYLESAQVEIDAVAGNGQLRVVSAASAAIFSESMDNYGVWGTSEGWRGITGRTDRPDQNYGLYTPDNLFSLNVNRRGSTMQLVRNGSPSPIMPGDVVTFTGVERPTNPNDPPTILVSSATQKNSTAVAGVVFARFNINAIDESRDQEDHEDIVTSFESVEPGAYLLVVTQGPALMNASALQGAIQPGDLVASTGEVGHGGRAEGIAGMLDAVPGTVVGKALESLGDGREPIYVYVTLD